MNWDIKKQKKNFWYCENVTRMMYKNVKKIVNWSKCIDTLTIFIL